MVCCFSLEKELVNEGITGRTFKDCTGLTEHFNAYFATENGCEQLQKLKENVIKRDKETGSWEDEWEKNGLPIFMN